jgi:signal transduction histidine kinase
MKVNDILDYSEIEANTFETKKEWFKMKPFIRDIYDMFRPNVMEKTLALNVFMN